METLKKYDVDPLTPGRSITELAASPDGEKILFTRVMVNEEEDKYESHAFVKRISSI